MTQEKFSELLGVTYNTYRSWEGGYRKPSSPALSLLYIAKIILNFLNMTKCLNFNHNFHLSH